jgi:hypothetical protein
MPRPAQSKGKPMSRRTSSFAALAALALGGFLPGNASAATLTVANQAELDRAIVKASGGETIALAPGVYSLNIQNRSFIGTIVITSANPARPARISAHELRNVSNVTFTRLEIGRPGTPGMREDVENAGKITGGSNITYDAVHVHGSLNNNARDDIVGLQFGGTRNIRVVNSEFQQLGRGIRFGDVDHLIVANNKFHHMRSDALDFAAASNVLIQANYFTETQRVKHDHPDAIQFWTVNAKRPSTDIVIRDNEIIQGGGDGTQGIFMTDQSSGTLPYERIMIENNIMIGSNMANGILIADGKDVTLRNNTVISPTDDKNPVWIKMVRVQGLVSENNIADVGGNKMPDRAKLNMSLLKTEKIATLKASDFIVPGIGYQPDRRAPLP